MTPNNRPLDGIRILDFTRVLAGPLATALLADLGAEVIKIEPPQGDDYRAIGPMKNGESALFSVMNRGKKSLVLDLKSAAARELVEALARQADVVVENFRPGVAERLGIGPERLGAINPRLVYVSVSGFGQDGPLAHRPAYDIIVQAMSGLMEATGDPAGPPTLVGEAVSDVVAGLFASWATLAALLQRERGGPEAPGQHLDVAMFDTTLAFLVTSMARYLFTGKPARRVGNRHPLSAPFGVYRAQDGHFALAVLNPKLFEALAGAMGQPALVADPRFASDETRSEHEPALRTVTLATLHAAKGLEWPHVHLVGLSEGLLPISYATGFEQIDEERRLAYVGVTRAGRTLSLSWSEQVGSSTQGSARPRQRSRFVQEIGTGNLRAGGARATRAARPRS